MATPQFIQKAYIAFFNRPADKAGFDFWQGTDLPDQALLDQFAQSPEYLSDYAGKSNKQIIEMVYKNLFGREPEQEGWDYWAKQMDDGWVTVGNAAYEILGGAQGTDKTIINNKTAAAQSFTSALNNGVNADAYAKAGDNGVGNLAKEWLSEVDAGSTQFNPAAVLSALVSANSTSTPGPTPDPDNVYDFDFSSLGLNTYPLSVDEGVSDMIKFSGPGYNMEFGGVLEVANFDTNDDYLDFSSYGAKWIGAAEDIVYVSGTGEILNIPTYDDWIAGSPFPRTGWNEGDKYITLLPMSYPGVYQGGLLYGIELWTVQGDYADAIYPPDIYDPTDRFDIIGYIDLNGEIDNAIMAHIVF